MQHQSVLLREIVENLEIKDNDVIVDMTLGGAGHSEAILGSGAKDLILIGIDADQDAIKRAEEKLKKFHQENKIILENQYFDSLAEILKNHKINKINKVIFDLGYSSFEVDSADRGFSFQHDGPLKMTYTKKPAKNQLTAYDVVNHFSEENLADIIYGYGEEKFSRRIAKAIVEKRNQAPIESTTELSNIISESVPKFYRLFRDGGGSKTHPATKTFQAIRITVNSELERLKIALDQAFEALEPEGKIAVISFHSLEDRIVKRYFKSKAVANEGFLITKKPIIPTRSEIKNNPRSRSAKLRIIEKI